VSVTIYRQDEKHTAESIITGSMSSHKLKASYLRKIKDLLSHTPSFNSAKGNNSRPRCATLGKQKERKYACYMKQVLNIVITEAKLITF